MSKGLPIYPVALIAALLLHLLLLTVQTNRRPLLPDAPPTRIAIRLRAPDAPVVPVVAPPAVVRSVVEKENQNQKRPPLPVEPVRRSSEPPAAKPVTAPAPTPPAPAAPVAAMPAEMTPAVVTQDPATVAPAFAAVPVSSIAPPSGRLTEYLATVRAQVESAKDYPAFARQLRLQGTATVRVAIGQDGRLRNAVILTSSGHARLDKAALAAVRNAGRFVPPENYHLGEVSVDIPITYKLI